MKQLLLLILFLSVEQLVCAQEDSTTVTDKIALDGEEIIVDEKLGTINYKRIELGLNVTTVIASFVGSSSFDIDPGNFPFMFKIVGKNRKRALRFGLGLDVKLSQDDELNINTNTSSENAVHLKAGYEWRQQLHKRWTTYFGVDVLTAYQRDENKTRLSNEVITISQTDYSLGAGPVYGVLFDINKRLFLGFEGSFYATTTYSVEKEEFSLTSLFDREDSSWHQTASITVPKWLYLYVRF